MTIIRAGQTCFLSSPIAIVDTIVPYAGVKSADLMTGSTIWNNPQRVNLGNLNGTSLIPSAATKFKVGCHLFRAIPDANGNVDVSCVAYLPGLTAFPGISNFATAAFSGATAPAKMFPPGSLVESVGQILEFPNITDASGNWGGFYWQMGGNTILGSAVWLELVSFDVPSGYTLPSVWPAQNPGGSLAMYLGTSAYADSSSAAHSVTAHNSTIQADGGASFNGSSSYLSFNGSDSSLSFTGDFTVEVTIAGTSKAMEGGSQQRILSFGAPGGGGIGIGIDQIGGGAILLNEFTSVFKTGGNSVVTGIPTTIKWTRESGVNKLSINGQQDGPTFTDTTSWMASSSAEIGRLNGQAAVGHFTGEIYNINIVNGLSV